MTGKGESSPPERAAAARRNLTAAALGRSAGAAARDALAPALLAGTAGIAATLAARVLFGVATPAELIGGQLTTRIPLGLFEALLRLLGHDAKRFFFAGLMAAQGLGCAALAASYWGARAAWSSARARPAAGAREGTRAIEAPRAGPWDAGLIAAACWLVPGLVVAPLAGGGLLGGGLNGGAGALTLADLVPALTAGVAFVALQRRAADPPAADEAPDAVARPGRRRALRQLGFGLALLAGAAAAWEFIVDGAASLGLAGSGRAGAQLDLGPVPERVVPAPVPTYGPWTPVPGQTPEVTPAPDFYYVSKNLFADPQLDAAGWRLSIGGLVERPFQVGYDQLRALPAVAQYQTLECISNVVGGDLMSTGRWEGVRVADLLATAGIRAGAGAVVFRCADGYSDSLHLAQALGPRALLAYALDGAPLAAAHGYPARLLVPGLYGMKNGKWVTELEVAAGPIDGYWEQQGWTREAIVKTTARIDVPADGSLLAARPTVVAGVAFAGDRGIGRVEVSADAGRTWAAAELKRPPAEQTWVLWRHPWRPAPGFHVLAVRAIDLDGRVQTPVQAPTLPDGASGYHAIAVTVG